MPSAPTITTGGFTKPVDASLVVYNDVSGNPVPASAATPLPVSATVTVTGGATTLAQDSTTAGQTGTLVQAAVTTAAPTYTTGKTNPLSLTTGGALRVSDVASATLATVAKQPALGVSGTPSADVISIQGFGFTGTATVTRAANATPYSIGDVVGGALTIANIGPNAGEIFLTALRLLWNITALPSGMGSFTLYLYNATPPSAIADNSPFTLGSGDRSAFLTSVTFSVAAVGIGTQSVFGAISSVNEQLRLVGGTSLFAYLVTNAAYTPAANSETAALTAKSIAA